MKIMRYSRKSEKASQARLGVLVGNDLIADLRAGYARYLIDEIGNAKGRELAAIFLRRTLRSFCMSARRHGRRCPKLTGGCPIS